MMMSHLSTHFPSLEELDLRFVHSPRGILPLVLPEADAAAHCAPSADWKLDRWWRSSLFHALKIGLEPLLTRSLRTLRLLHALSTVVAEGFQSRIHMQPRIHWTRSDVDELLPVVAPHLRTLRFQTYLAGSVESRLMPDAIEILVERAPNLEFFGIQVEPADMDHVHLLTSKLQRLDQLSVRLLVEMDMRHRRKHESEDQQKAPALPRLPTAQSHLPVCHLIADTPHMAHPIFRFLPPSIGQLCISRGSITAEALFEYAQYFPLALHASFRRLSSGAPLRSGRFEAITVKPSFFDVPGVQSVQLKDSEWAAEYKNALKSFQAAAATAAKERSSAASSSSVSSPPLLPRGVPQSLYLVLVDLFPPHGSIDAIFSPTGLPNCVGVWRDRVYYLSRSSDPAACAESCKWYARFYELEREVRARMHDDPLKTHTVALETRA